MTSRVEQVRKTLEPYLSDARKTRIEEVLRMRTPTIRTVLERTGNPRNTSAVLRTCDALGIQNVDIVEDDTPFRVSKNIEKGTHQWLSLQAHQSIPILYDRLRASGFRVCASALTPDSRPLSEVPLDRPIAVVFGNEIDGVTREAQTEADLCFKVPMLGFVESYNISVASALVLRDLRQRFEARGELGPLSEVKQNELRALWYVRSVRAARELLAREGIPWSTPDRAPILWED